MEISLGLRAELMSWRIGQRIDWRPRVGLLMRAWRWVKRDNWRVASINFDAETLVVERCR